MVQEWNTYEEFYDHWISKGATQENDPDVGGVVTRSDGLLLGGGEEGSDCDYEERLTQTLYYNPCNDKLDLDDFSGYGSYPEVPYN